MSNVVTFPLAVYTKLSQPSRKSFSISRKLWGANFPQYSFYSSLRYFWTLRIPHLFRLPLFWRSFSRSLTTNCALCPPGMGWMSFHPGHCEGRLQHPFCSIKNTQLDILVLGIEPYTRKQSARDLSLFSGVWTAYGVHPTSCNVGNGRAFHGRSCRVLKLPISKFWCPR